MHGAHRVTGMTASIETYLITCIATLRHAPCPGLHVQEVRQLLPQQLQELQASRQQSINIIVGAGRHTKGPPSARLAPAVEALLQELGYTYKQLQPGLLRVQLH